MKTAISIPDEIFTSADQLAQRMGLSRSELYVIAIKDYVSHHHDDGLVDQINRVCEKTGTEIDPGLVRAQSRAIKREDW
jgi:metal-responsive CopG/Arc/MetJ family transcriptional regulator